MHEINLKGSKLDRYLNAHKRQLMNNKILIKNGFVMDGTGKPAVRADVLIKDDRIQDVGLFPDVDDGEVIDARGLIVAPGFIDVHTHLDFLLPSTRHAKVMEKWVRQGVTSIVAGNCGWSPAPITSESQSLIDIYWNFAQPREGLNFNWRSMGEFLDTIAESGQALNVAILTGQCTLRAHAMGFKSRFARIDEIDEMKELLRASLEAGSFGLSLGLYYVPGTFASTDEISDLASILKEFDAPLVPHTRGLTSCYDKAIEEVVWIAERHGIPLQISHHAGLDEKNERVRARAVAIIEEAKQRGVRIGHDNMPWAAGPTTLLSMLPPRLFANGLEAFFLRIQDANIRKQAIEEMKTAVPGWPNWEHGWWTDKFFSDTLLVCGFRQEKNKRFEKQSIMEIAAALGKNPYDTVFDLIKEENGKIFVIGFSEHPLAEAYMEFLFQDPDCSVMTDVVGADFESPNPVEYGAFTKVLGEFARDKGLMSQAEAVRRMTSLPAAQMMLKDRGLLLRGKYADICIFDADNVRNRATFSDPYHFSEGIVHVLVNGKKVLENGVYHENAFAGAVLRHR